MATNTKPLKQRSTDELETAIQSGYFDNIQTSEAERILREREREPDRKLARRTYNAAAWARAYSEGTFIVALIIVWLVATGEPAATTSHGLPAVASLRFCDNDVLGARKWPGIRRRLTRYLPQFPLDGQGIKTGNLSHDYPTGKRTSYSDKSRHSRG